ncbi:D-Ala-D-Ala carboxypeptidase family metallohydrolase [Synergistaceae bacterium OttesenSCG-928-D05]|nr:D-Ala-D-Ala carboxypeptidase family metallohydrolase [Synergistaceae bacterium OttesenSCG-928-D05]
MRVNELRVSENFKLREFECPCCKTVKLHPLLLERLQELRNIWQRPIVITSGYRCEKRNSEVGGVPRSRHREGRAADIHVPANRQEEFKRLAEVCGFAKVILYLERGFVHLET